jgi:transposase InsO family protein
LKVTPGKRGPKPTITDEQLLKGIKAAIATSPFHGEGHRKVCAKLRMGITGIAPMRVSRERVLRVMRENGLLSAARSPWRPELRHDGRITTDAPNVMWGTDMTSTVLCTGRNAYVFAVVDHCAQDCIGIHVSDRATRYEAIEPVRKAIEQVYGGCDEQVAAGVGLRHDCGSAYLSGYFQDEVAFLGIESSPSYVRQPEGNGVVERFFKTLKEQLLWVKSFESIEALSDAVTNFVKTYNSCWMVAKHGYRSPSQVRERLMANRAA